MRPRTSLLCLSIGLALLAGGMVLTDEQATITVNDEVIRSGLSPESFCVVNWEFSGHLHSLREIWDNCYGEFIDHLRANGLRAFRYPGGGYVAHFFPGVSSEAWFPDFKAGQDGPHRPDDWIEYEEFLQFLADGDFKAIVQLNTHYAFDPKTSRRVPLRGEDGELSKHALDLATDAARRAVRQAKRMKMLGHVTQWEIGNEDYFSFTPEQYGEIARRFIEAIRGVDPGASILVTTQWSFPSAAPESRRLDWSVGVLQYLDEHVADRTNISFVNHEYAWVMEDYEHSAYDEWKRYVGTNPTHRYEQPWGELPCAPYDLLFGAYDGNGFSGAGLHVTEFRYGWMTNLYNKSLGSGVANVNLVLHYMKHPRIRGAAAHSLMHGSRVSDEAERPFGAWGFNIIEYTPTDRIPHNFVSTPMSQGYRLIERFCRGELLAAESSTWNLNVGASRDAGVLRLLVVNRTRDSEESAESNVVAAGLELPEGWEVGSALVHVLNSETFADRSGALQTYDEVNEILVRTREVDAPEAGELTFEFPPHSATLVELALE